MKLPAAVLLPVELAFNRYLSLDSSSVARLERLRGKSLAIHMTGLEATVFLLFGSGSVTLLADYVGEPDATMSGPPFSLARLALSDANEPAVFGGDVAVDGDTDVVQRFKQLIDGMNVDWEEHLSRVIGDVAAHQVGNLFRATGDWGRQATDTLQMNTAEYLQEETSQLPRPDEVRQFIGDVDTLRSDLDRLAARLERLEEQTAAGSNEGGAAGS